MSVQRPAGIRGLPVCDCGDTNIARVAKDGRIFRLCAWRRCGYVLWEPTVQSVKSFLAGRLAGIRARAAEAKKLLGYDSALSESPRSVFGAIRRRTASANRVLFFTVLATCVSNAGALSHGTSGRIDTETVVSHAIDMPGLVFTVMWWMLPVFLVAAFAIYWSRITATALTFSSTVVHDYVVLGSPRVCEGCVWKTRAPTAHCRWLGGIAGRCT